MYFQALFYLFPSQISKPILLSKFWSGHFKYGKHFTSKFLQTVSGSEELVIRDQSGPAKVHFFICKQCVKWPFDSVSSSYDSPRHRIITNCPFFAQRVGKNFVMCHHFHKSQRPNRNENGRKWNHPLSLFKIRNLNFFDFQFFFID